MSESSLGACREMKNKPSESEVMKSWIWADLQACSIASSVASSTSTESATLSRIVPSYRVDSCATSERLRRYDLVSTSTMEVSPKRICPLVGS